MPRHISLIDLDEIKTLRFTCKKCHSYWALPIPLGENKVSKKCNCNNGITEDHVGYVGGLIDNIDHIQKFLKGFDISIEVGVKTEDS